jgi:hypothetical protein
MAAIDTRVSRPPLPATSGAARRDFGLRVDGGAKLPEGPSPIHTSKATVKSVAVWNLSAG